MPDAEEYSKIFEVLRTLCIIQYNFQFRMRSRTVNLLQKVSITGLFVQIEQSREKRKALHENKHEDKNKNKRKNSNIATFGSSVPDSIFYLDRKSTRLNSSHG